MPFGTFRPLRRASQGAALTIRRLLKKAGENLSLGVLCTQAKTTTKGENHEVRVHSHTPKQQNQKTCHLAIHLRNYSLYSGRCKHHTRPLHSPACRARDAYRLDNAYGTLSLARLRLQNRGYG